jgi:hypothetical protein
MTIVFAQNSFAQDPLAGLGALTLAAALNKIGDRVDSSIEKAGTVANGVVIRAGGEVWAEIDNMRNAAKDVLDKLVKDLDATMTKQLAQISSDANALERKTAQDAERVLSLAQATANIIPFSRTQPQVTFISPGYGVYNPDAPQETILLTLRGNFFDSSRPGMAPFATVAGGQVNPVEVTTEHIMFSIPTRILAPTQELAVPLVKIPITIPYKETKLLVFNSRQEAKFTAALVGLPPSPGVISITITTDLDVPARDQRTTTQDNIQSDKDDHDEIRCGPNESKTIDPASVRMVLDHVEGNSWTANPVRLNNPSVCWHFRTEHHGLGTSDKLWFHFTYSVTYTVHTSTSSTQALTLKWGDSKVFNAPAGHYKITYKSFDGSTQEFLASNHDNRFIDISDEGGGVRIAARPLEGILPLQ